MVRQGRKCAQRIDNYERLEEEKVEYKSATNQLISLPTEQYRWIRERIVWGMEFPNLVRDFAVQFEMNETQAVWIVKAELNRLSQKIVKTLVNSKVSELSTWRSLQFIYNQALDCDPPNLQIALDAQRAIMDLSQLYRQKWPAGNKPATPAKSTKMSAGEKKARSVVREVRKRAEAAAELAARIELQEKLEKEDVQNLTDEELLRKMRWDDKAAPGITLLHDTKGNPIPEITPEMAKRMTGGRRD